MKITKVPVPDPKPGDRVICGASGGGFGGPLPGRVIEADINVLKHEDADPDAVLVLLDSGRAMWWARQFVHVCADPKDLRPGAIFTSANIRDRKFMMVGLSLHVSVDMNLAYGIEIGKPPVVTPVCKRDQAILLGHIVKMDLLQED